MVRSRTRLVRSWLSAHLRRNIERGIGLFAHDAVDCDAVPRLEAAHRRLDGGIEDVALTPALVEIAFDDEPLTKRGDRRVAACRPQPARPADRRPAALRRDRLVAGNGLLGV